jgi:hypothetical protein
MERGSLQEMATLSVLSEDGMMVICASPIYLTSAIEYRPGAKLMFEVLEADATSLKRLVGKTETFGMDPTQLPFTAQLTNLESCTSTVEALALLRDRPAMRGVLVIRGLVDLTKPLENLN